MYFARNRPPSPPSFLVCCRTRNHKSFTGEPVKPTPRQSMCNNRPGVHKTCRPKKLGGDWNNGL